MGEWGGGSRRRFATDFATFVWSFQLSTSSVLERGYTVAYDMTVDYTAAASGRVV